MKNKTILFVYISFVLLWFVLFLFDPLDFSIWQGFADPYDYIEQSTKSLFSIDFWSPIRHGTFDPRPFTTPLFYKLSGSDPTWIIIVQKILHLIAHLYFIYAFLPFFDRKIAKYFFIVSITLLMCWWNTAGWTILLLSESIAWSLLMIWLASFIQLYNNKTRKSLFIHIAILILFVFTRDSWPYPIFIFYSSFYLVDFFLLKKKSTNTLILLSILFMLYFLQKETSKVGERYRLPVFNNLMYRIAHNDQHLSWFEKHGLPDVDKIKLVAKTLDSESAIFQYYSDSSFNKVFNWIKEDGQTTYMKFLISHPRKLFLFEESREDLMKMYDYQFGYFKESPWYVDWLGSVFPLAKFPFLIISFIGLVVVFVWYKRQKEFVVYFVMFLLLFTFTNALLMYHADFLEIRRHLYVTIDLIQIIFIFNITYILQFLDLSKILNIKSGK